MITFKELLELAKNDGIVVHTPTEEQANLLLKKLDKMGYKWGSRDKLTAKNYWNEYKESMCYNLVQDGINFSGLNYFIENSYTVIKFDEISDFTPISKGESKSLVIKTIYQSKDKTTTVVVFEDGEKIKVKKHKGDKASIYTAVAYAITKKIYRHTKMFSEVVDSKLYKEKK